tara:strand:+ start:1013 stop:1243 length:231 start_codon:yes stop_codon:yes gene_type:complete
MTPAKQVVVSQMKYSNLLDTAFKSDQRLEQIISQAKSIRGLIDRMQELEGDLKYEVRLNERLRSSIKNLQVSLTTS